MPAETRTGRRAAGPLDEPGIAYFEAADGTTFESETVVTLPTGGSPEGRLLPASTSDEVTLYVTRDGACSLGAE